MHVEHTTPETPADPAAALGDSRVIETTAGPVRIYERGTGAPLVFVQGLLADATAWRKVVPLLAGSYRCVTADWPFGAHRLPMAPDADLTPTGLADIVAEVIDHLDLRDTTLIGNDGGGLLTQLVVTRRAERLGRVVLTSCDAYENFPPPLYDYLCLLARVPAVAALAARALRLSAVRTVCARSRLGFGALTTSPLDPAVADHYLHGIAHDPAILRDTLTFLRAVDNRYTLDAATRFPAVTLPVLIAWAGDDQVFPLRHARQLAADFPNARLAVIPDSRTWIGEDQPEALAQLVREFLDQAG
ncbi:alpha/beta fold hydrolase [Nocardia sp. SSK8]|uniref:alpha/beta fold hydrolase n=1 Tax=Nocardia sp. SSK8 TaxID=3120154 RepID=UPI00300A0636